MTFDDYQKWCSQHDVAQAVSSVAFNRMDPTARSQFLLDLTGQDRYRRQLEDALHRMDPQMRAQRLKSCPYSIRVHFGDGR